MSVQVKISVCTVVRNADGDFLMVGEYTEDGYRYNQPCGHLEPGETPQECAVRETLEETGYTIQLRSFVGAYIMQRASNGASYLRLCFEGVVDESVPRKTEIDSDINEVVWMTKDEIIECSDQHRNPMVLECVEESYYECSDLQKVKMFNI